MISEVWAADSDDGRVHVDLSSGFEGFYAANYLDAVRLGLILTGQWAAAEDVAQEAFVAAYRHWPKVSLYEYPVGWLHRVITNKCISRQRRLRSQLQLLSRLGHARSTTDEPDFQADLWKAVRRLPPRQAQVMSLVILGDYSPAAIASTLGCRESTVRTHLARGRATLAEALQIRNGDCHDDR